MSHVSEQWDVKIAKFSRTTQKDGRFYFIIDFHRNVDRNVVGLLQKRRSFMKVTVSVTKRGKYPKISYQFYPFK